MKFNELFKLPPRTFGPPQVPYRPKEIPNLFWINYIYQCSQCRELTGWHVEVPDGSELRICSTECLTAFSAKSDGKDEAKAEEVKAVEPEVKQEVDVPVVENVVENKEASTVDAG